MGRAISQAGLLLILTALNALHAQVQLDDKPLRFGEAYTAAIQPGTSNRHRIAKSTAAGVVIEVESSDTSIRCSLLDSEHAVLAKVDSPGHREFTEVLLLRPDSDATAILEVAIEGPGIPAGTYRIIFHPVTDQELPAWTKIFKAGELFAQGGKDDKRPAADLYRQAADEWKGLGNPYRQAMASHFAGIIYYLLDDKGAALAMLEAAHDILVRLGSPFAADARTYIGLVRYRMAQTNEAIRLVESALAANVNLGRAYRAAFAQNNLALIHHNAGNLAAAERLYREAAAGFERLGEWAELATPLNNLGGIHYMRGRPAQAFEYFERSLSIARDTGDLSKQADALGNLASLHKLLGNFDEFLTRQFEIKDIRERRGQPDGVARTLHSIGVGYFEQGAYDKALNHLHQAREMRERLAENAELAGTYHAIGKVRVVTGEFDAALKAFDQALELERKAGKPSPIARVKMSIAQARLTELKSSSRAESYAVLAEIAETARAAAATFSNSGERRYLIEALLTLGEIGQLEQDPRARTVLEDAVALAQEIKTPEYEIKAWLLLAATAYDAGDLDAGLSYLGQAIERVESSRATIYAPSLRATYLATRSEIFELRTELLVEKYLRSRRPEDAFAALAAHEESTARSLRELARRRPAGVARSEVDARRAELHDRLAAVTFALKLAVDTKQADEAEALEDELTSLLARLDRLNEQDESHRAKTERALDRKLDLAELQRRLDSETSVLVYALGPRRSFQWTIDSTGMEMHLLPPRDVITRQVEAIYQFFSTPRFGATHAIGRETLTAMLLPGLERHSGVSRLLVVPDGALSYLPFAALMDPSLETDSMLIERYEIGLAPSTHFLVDGADDGGSPLLRDALLVGDPTSPFGALPHVAEEINRIAGLFSNSTSLQGAAATRSDVVRRMPTAGLIHFATHGFVDDRNPEASGLAVNDGVLLLPEIMTLRLAAKSVVLSACDSALGKHVNAEGLIGLTYGFLAAGAEGVVSSRWKIADRHTPAFMAIYYDRLSQGDSSSSALRTAQLAFLRDPQTRSPYYWASFAHFGKNH